MQKWKPEKREQFLFIENDEAGYVESPMQGYLDSGIRRIFKWESEKEEIFACGMRNPGL